MTKHDDMSLEDLRYFAHVYADAKVEIDKAKVRVAECAARWHEYERDYRVIHFIQNYEMDYKQYLCIASYDKIISDLNDACRHLRATGWRPEKSSE